jgi:hypothetical protein
VCVYCLCVNPKDILPKCPGVSCGRDLSVYEFLEKFNREEPEKIKPEHSNGERYKIMKSNKKIEEENENKGTKIAEFFKKRKEKFIEDDVRKQPEVMNAVNIYNLLLGTIYGEPNLMINQFFATILALLPEKDRERILMPMVPKYFTERGCELWDFFYKLKNIPIDIFLQEYDASINLEYVKIDDINNIYATHLVLNIVPDKTLEKIIDACMNRVIGSLKEGEELKQIDLIELHKTIQPLSKKDALLEAIKTNQTRLYLSMRQQHRLEFNRPMIGLNLQKLRDLHSTEADTIILETAKKLFNLAEPQLLFKINIKDHTWRKGRPVSNSEAIESFTIDYLSYQKNKLPPNEIISKCFSCKGMIIKIEDKFICNTCARLYCVKCLTVLVDNHVCAESDLKTVEEILINSKSCPGCGVRIHKTAGCIDMFCVKCKSGFNYKTGAIIEGAFHNPHRSMWLAKLPPEFENEEVPVVFKNGILQGCAILRLDIHELIANYGTPDHRIEDNLFTNRFLYMRFCQKEGEYKKHIEKIALYDLFVRGVGAILTDLESKISIELITAKKIELLENNTDVKKQIDKLSTILFEAKHRLDRLEVMLCYRNSTVTLSYSTKLYSILPRHKNTK